MVFRLAVVHVEVFIKRYGNVSAERQARFDPWSTASEASPGGMSQGNIRERSCTHDPWPGQELMMALSNPNSMTLMLSTSTESMEMSVKWRMVGQLRSRALKPGKIMMDEHSALRRGGS